MKKLIMTATAMAALVMTGAAGAQTLKIDGGNLQLLGCYRAEEGVMCDLSFVPQANGGKGFDARSFNTLTLGGENIQAAALVIKGDKMSYYNFNGYAGAPVKLSVLFGMKPVPAQLRVFAFGGMPIYNVSVRGGAPAPAAPAGSVLKIDSTQFNAVMTNCRVQDNALYCDAALTPKR